MRAIQYLVLCLLILIPSSYATTFNASVNDYGIEWVQINFTPQTPQEYFDTATGPYLYGILNAIFFNESVLNSTIDTRSVAVGSKSGKPPWLHNSTTQVIFNETYWNDSRGKFDGTTLKQLDKNAQIAGPVFGINQTGPSGTNLPHFVLQSGGATQASYIMRSFAIVNEIPSFFSTINRTHMGRYVAFINDSLMIDFNTTTTGADLYVSDDLQVRDEVWLKDTDGEYHFMTRELELLDELRVNNLISSINSTVVLNNLTIIEAHNKSLVVNINENNTILSKSVDSIILNEGTNTSPNFIHVYYNNAVDPTLTQSLTPQSNKPDVAQFMMGANYSYGDIISSTASNKFIRGVYHRFFDDGAIYISGFDINASTEIVNISFGVMKIMLQGTHIISNFSTSIKSIHIHADGTFHQHDNLDNFTDYDSGEGVSNNKYYSIVFGVVHTSDGIGRMYGVVQSKPPVEFTKSIDAETDTTYVNLFPSQSLIKKLFIPVVKVVVKLSGTDVTVQTLSNGLMYVDLRGTVTTSGGSAPTPGITSHPDLNNLLWSVAGHTFDTAVDFNANDIYNIANVNASDFFDDGDNLRTMIEAVNASHNGTVDADTYNTTLQMRQAVNETVINASKMFESLCRNLSWTNSTHPQFLSDAAGICDAKDNTGLGFVKYNTFLNTFDSNGDGDNDTISFNATKANVTWINSDKNETLYGSLNVTNTLLTNRLQIKSSTGSLLNITASATQTNITFDTDVIFEEYTYFEKAMFPGDLIRMRTDNGVIDAVDVSDGEIGFELSRFGLLMYDANVVIVSNEGGKNLDISAVGGDLTLGDAAQGWTNNTHLLANDTLYIGWDYAPPFKGNGLPESIEVGVNGVWNQSLGDFTLNNSINLSQNGNISAIGYVCDQAGCIPQSINCTILGETYVTEITKDGAKCATPPAPAVYHNWGTIHPDHGAELSADKVVDKWYAASDDGSVKIKGKAANDTLNFSVDSVSHEWLQSHNFTDNIIINVSNGATPLVIDSQGTSSTGDYQQCWINGSTNICLGYPLANYYGFVGSPDFFFTTADFRAYVILSSTGVSTFNTFGGLQITDTIAVTGDIGVTGTVIPNNDCGITNTAFTAEENAALGNNLYEWSYGNGAAGANIATVQICSGRITGMSWSCITGGTATNITIRDDGATTDCTCKATANKCSTTCDVAFATDSRLTPFTLIAGGASNCVVTWWVRYD